MADTPKKTERKAGLRQSNAALWSGIRALILETRWTVVRGVNAALVWTNFEIGRRIVEHEQGGKSRADYAEETLISLSQKLTVEFGRGYSVDNLELMRQFYFVYAKSETLSRKSESSTSPADKKSETLLRIPPITFQLSWSHYVFLMGIDDKSE
jgi:hypothetical protein